MTEKEALKLALEALEDLGMKHFESTGELLAHRAITAIKEALAQPEQEPVAYWNFNSGFSHCMIDQLNEAAKKNPAPLYTTPPQRKPLTDEEIILIVAECAASHQHTDIHFARAIERAHGIKELL